MFENYKVRIYSNLEIMKFGIERTQIWTRSYRSLEIYIFGNYKVQIYSTLEILKFGIDHLCKCS